jgi:hypothetical protein
MICLTTSVSKVYRVRFTIYGDHAAREIAKQEHVSINQFIMLAVAEKVSVLGAQDILMSEENMAVKRNFYQFLEMLQMLSHKKKTSFKDNFLNASKSSSEFELGSKKQG